MPFTFPTSVAAVIVVQSLTERVVKMGLLVPLVLAASLVSPRPKGPFGRLMDGVDNFGALGAAPPPGAVCHPGIRLGMSRAEVERLIGEPTHGEDRSGDPLDGRVTAIYRWPRLKAITYAHGRVVRVVPPPPPDLIAP